MNGSSISRAVTVFEKQGGILKTSQAVSFGIHPETLYKLRDEGIIHNLSRGLYCLSNSDIMYNPDLVAASYRVPKGVICLTSALVFHEITTQVPSTISLAIPRGTRQPVVDYPPIEFYLFGEDSFDMGIELHAIADAKVKVYSPEKTVADCFKFRNRIGLDVAVEALRCCRERKGSTPADFLEYARACRVERVMTPYLEAIY
jgi:predicted transcriptional regulator of viral defense system